MLTASSVLGLLLSSLAQVAGAPAPQEAESRLPDVVVQGRVLNEEQLEDLARDFIGEVSAPPRGFRVARWHRSVCVGVVNLPREAAQFVADRVSAVAADVGLDPGEPGCRPEVVIIATVDGATVAGGLVDRHRRTFSPGGDGYSLSRAALERFATEDRPVRWWHVSTPRDPETGRRVSRLLGVDLEAGGGLTDLPRMQARNTLLAATTREDLARAIIIVDFDRLDGVDFDQLADYLAFVSLSQVDPEAETSAAPTILNLFNDPTSVSGLTDWDRAYLRGLYQSDDRAPNPNAREGAIRREMLRAREEVQDDDAD